MDNVRESQSLEIDVHPLIPEEARFLQIGMLLHAPQYSSGLQFEINS